MFRRNNTLVIFDHLIWEFTHFPLSLTASSNLPSAMAAVTSLVCDRGSLSRQHLQKHSTFSCGRLTYHLDALHEWQPDGLVPWKADHARRGVGGGLQQGHHGLNAHPASLERHRQQQQQLPDLLHAGLRVCCVTERLTRILSKADGVPPLCTWPKTVVRVSKPSLSVTSWRKATSGCYCHIFFRSSVEERFNLTDLLDLVGCDQFAVSGYGALGHYDHVETRASASLLGRQSERIFARAKRHSRASHIQALLRLPASCTSGPPSRDLGASPGWTPSRLRRPGPSPRPGTCSRLKRVFKHGMYFFLDK